ncbi:Uncharacterised protein [Mycobacterium tuberculosis]|nr:Uncharacterised protein [Mycobacterium tuberculosis]
MRLLLQVHQVQLQPMILILINILGQVQIQTMYMLGQHTNTSIL